MIALQHIVKKGKKGKYLLDHLNLNINKGEFLAITYTSEDSKVALIKILAGIDQDFYGAYFFDGQKIDDYAKENQKFTPGLIGLLINHINLIDHLSVEENILIPLSHQNISLRQKESRLEKSLTDLKISHLKHHYPDELSDLIKIKISIAQCLILSPKLLIVDSVVDSLNSEEQTELFDLLSHLNNQGLTIVVALQHVKESNAFHRIIHLNEGNLVLQNK